MSAKEALRNEGVRQQAQGRAQPNVSGEGQVHASEQQEGRSGCRVWGCHVSGLGDHGRPGEAAIDIAGDGGHVVVVPGGQDFFGEHADVDEAVRLAPREQAVLAGGGAREVRCGHALAQGRRTGAQDREGALNRSRFWYTRSTKLPFPKGWPGGIRFSSDAEVEQAFSLMRIHEVPMCHVPVGDTMFVLKGQPFANSEGAEKIFDFQGANSKPQYQCARWRGQFMCFF